MSEHHLTPDDVRKVAKLARLSLPDDKLSRLTTQLESILHYIDKLAEVETSGVEPARLSLIRVFVTVSVPALSMPPPKPNAHGSGPQKFPGGAAVCGVTVIPVFASFALPAAVPPGIYAIEAEILDATLGVTISEDSAALIVAP